MDSVVKGGYPKFNTLEGLIQNFLSNGMSIFDHIDSKLLVMTWVCPFLTIFNHCSQFTVTCILAQVLWV